MMRITYLTSEIYLHILFIAKLVSYKVSNKNISHKTLVYQNSEIFTIFHMN